MKLLEKLLIYTINIAILILFLNILQALKQAQCSSRSNNTQHSYANIESLPILTSEESQLNIFILTHFYPFIEQQITDQALSYRFQIMKNFTYECLKGYVPLMNFTWVILTSESVDQRVGLSSFKWELPSVMIEMNPYNNTNYQASESDFFELRRSGKFRFLVNKLPHLTILLDSVLS